MKKLTIVAEQINPIVGDIKSNSHLIIKKAKHARDKLAADIVVFPELALCGYPPEDLLFRAGFYRRSADALTEICKALDNVAMVIGYPKMIDGKRYNMAAFINNGEIIAEYAKRELPNYEVFDEVRYFSPGTTDCVVDFNGVKIGILVCEDLWLPQCSHSTAKAGAQIILSPNASPYDKNKIRARENMLRERATENKIPLVYCNIVGGQDEIVFDGGSMVVDAHGERIQQAAYYKEDSMVIEIDCTHKALEITPKKLPERLSQIENIYRTLVLGCRDYIHKNGFPGAIIGLSGGIDSALTLAITAEAIGPDKITAVMMPTRFTSKMSLEDAAIEAEKLQVDYRKIDIEDIFTSYLTSLEPHLHNEKWDTTEQNIQARIRGNLLMALSNRFGKLVITTGNKSEYAVGYSTLYGDMAGGFALLKDIPKTLVYKLATYCNRNGTIIPDRVIDRPPSAELSENQLDEHTLPPYSVLDEILARYIDNDEDPTEICKAGLDKETVNKVVKMINLNEYKRRQAPVGVRITQRAFGKDRRYPITSGYWKNI